jgi:stage IV sporulation protein FB
MLLQEPAESPYDLRFNLLKFPVRVSWSFWLGSVVLGFSLVEQIDRNFRDESPGRLPLLLMWSACVLVSILIHELGHALAFRQNGIESKIVLYHFGGLAIPANSYSPRRGFGALSEASNLWIAFAGPLAQFASAFLVIIIVMSTNHYVPGLPWFMDGLNDTYEGEPFENPQLGLLVYFYLWPSIMWALLNLVPVWPLDGGRITRSLMQMFGGNVEQSLWISIVAAVSIGIYAFRFLDQPFMALFMLSFAFANYQELSGPRY